jgi:hypothetical protein
LTSLAESWTARAAKVSVAGLSPQRNGDRSQT